MTLLPMTRAKRIVLVGEQPSVAAMRRQLRAGLSCVDPLRGKPTAWIAKVAEVAESLVLTVTERRNLIDRPPLYRGEFDAVLARAGAIKLEGELKRTTKPLTDTIVVLLGKRVAKAWGLDGAPWFVPHGSDAIFDYRSSFYTYVVPHPSGLNRWWNNGKNRRASRRFFRSLFGVDPL